MYIYFGLLDWWHPEQPNFFDLLLAYYNIIFAHSRDYAIFFQGNDMDVIVSTIYVLGFVVSIPLFFLDLILGNYSQVKGSIFYAIRLFIGVPAFMILYESIMRIYSGPARTYWYNFCGDWSFLTPWVPLVFSWVLVRYLIRAGYV